jgi:shikimate kinase/3-dehydroquinate synthase
MPDLAPPQTSASLSESDLLAALGARSIVLVGMMGAGKSSVGRRLAGRLSLPFVDADTEIESAAGMSIPDIFAAHGEASFRSGEQRVIARLLQNGPQVLATGGGAFMSAETRAAILAEGISIWLKADFDVLMRRIRRRTDRPMLKTDDPAATLKSLIELRYPVYAEADLTIESREVPHGTVVDEIVAALEHHLASAAASSQAPLGRNSERMMDPSALSRGATVHVDLAGRAYDIEIGRSLLAGLGERVRTLRPGAAVAIVTDEHVADYHLAAALASLETAGVRATRIVVPPGEGSKRMEIFEQVCDRLLEARVGRTDLVVALGGGVIGDLTGFAAAATRRGLDFIQVPTTLLAQVDSSVGGKTGINTRHGKNLIGAFHQPILVLADTALLDTLPRREFAAGYAELAKHGMINNEPFFAWLESNWPEVFSGGPAREQAIAVSCRTKAEIVARDEFETGDRQLLNLGHTFGHALEAGAGYSDRLLHGEAIAIGIVLAFGFSARLGLAPQADGDRVRRHLNAVGLPTRIAQIPGTALGIDRLMELIAQDKKVKHGKLTFILARGIGQAFTAPDVDPADVRAFLSDKLAEK